MALDEEARKRIEEEERFRVEARARAEREKASAGNSRKSHLGCLVGFIVVLILILYAFSRSSPDGGEPTRPLAESTTPIRATSRGGGAQNDVGEVDAATEDTAFRVPEWVLTDPEYQDWVRIDRRTAPFQRDMAWIKGAFACLLEANRKWEVEDAKSTLFHINKVHSENGETPYPSTTDLYDSIAPDLRFMRGSFKRAILGTIVFKRAVGLPFSPEEFDRLARSEGFGVHIPGKSDDLGRGSPRVIRHAYYKGYEIKRGERKGKGESLSATVYERGQVIGVVISFEKAKIDWSNIPRGPEKETFWRKKLNEVFSKPPHWMQSSLDLVFQQDAAEVARRVAEVGKAGDDELRAMFSGKEFERYATWLTKFSVGDKEITLFFVVGSAFMGVMRSETAELSEMLRMLTGW